MGGMFGAIATLGALIQRGITGRGMEVQSALFENNVFLMGQHMLQYAVTGRHPAPMPARDNPWAIYDVFTVEDGEQIFLAAVSDAQWRHVLRRARLRRPEGRSGATRRTTSASCCARSCSRRCASASPHRSADELRRHDGARRPAVRADPQAGRPLRRSAPAAPPAASPTCALPDGDKAGQTVKTTLLPITMAGSRLGVRLRSAAARRAHARRAVRARLAGRRDRRALPASARWPEANSTTIDRRQRDDLHIPCTRAPRVRSPLPSCGALACAHGVARPGRRQGRPLRPAERHRLGRRHDHPRRAAGARQGARHAGRRRQPAGRRRHRRPADADALGARRHDARAWCRTTSSSFRASTRRCRSTCRATSRRSRSSASRRS